MAANERRQIQLLIDFRLRNRLPNSSAKTNQRSPPDVKVEGKKSQIHLGGNKYVEVKIISPNPKSGNGSANAAYQALAKCYKEGAEEIQITGPFDENYENLQDAFIENGSETIDLKVIDDQRMSMSLSPPRELIQSNVFISFRLSRCIEYNNRHPNDHSTNHNLRRILLQHPNHHSQRFELST